MQDGRAAQLPPLLPAREPAGAERKHRAKASERGQGWDGTRMGMGLPQTAVGSAPAQAGTGIQRQERALQPQARCRLRCYFVWVRWERLNAPAVPDRRLRPEPNQERRSPWASTARDANPGR